MKHKCLIIGGAGFIGYNLSNYLKDNFEIDIIDNLSRETARINIENIKKQNFNFFNLDISEMKNLEIIFKEKKYDYILNLAAQVAVTTSIDDPIYDFNVNLLGTINILELLKKYQKNTFFVFSSTNKVYGKLQEYKIVENEFRYSFDEIKNIDEKQNLSFISPYGCSKGAAEQYVLDYGYTYNLNTTVLRKYCIYGQNQYGIEDQGWVSWFIINLLKEKKINIYGTGKQVRDILHINDLCELYKILFDKRDKVRGNAYNIGGGINNSVSLLELIKIAENISNKKFILEFLTERLGDQKVYISSIKKIFEDTNWKPKINTDQGIKLIYEWLSKNI